MKPIPIRQIASAKGSAAANFRIRRLDELVSDRDMVHELHRHNFYFILAIEKGRGTHEIDFSLYEIHDNSVFILRPGQVHQLTVKAKSIGYLLEFNSEFYPQNESLRTATQINFCRLDFRTFLKVRSILDYIAQEFEQRDERYEQVIKANLDIFFIELLRNRKQVGPRAAGTTYEQQKLQQFLALVEKNLRKQLHVSEYADALNVSPYQLNNITKSTLGKTASAVIDDHIVLEAKRYLLATPEQINQIAFHLGYEDPSYFI
ncbi:MAG TPA: AraC family transcriptional regulator, partial [Sphingobacteriaceae bacterium]